MQSVLKKAMCIGSTVLVAFLAIPIGQADADDTTIALNVQDSLIFARGQHFPSNAQIAVVAIVENGTGNIQQKSDGEGGFVVAFELPSDFVGGPVKISARTDGAAAESIITVAKTSTTTTTAVPVIVQAPTSTVPTTVPPTTTEVRPLERPAVAQAAVQAANPLRSENTSERIQGWRQVFREDFDTDLARGSWPGPYAPKWTSYDGFAGTYNTSDYENDILSVSNGNLDMFLHTENGRALTAAPVPITNGKAYEGHQYGRFSVRFRADSLPGYKTAWLMWPDTDRWTSEIDFPEGELSGTINAFNHCPGNASQNCLAVDTGFTYTDWHIATTEWTADSVKFYLDGRLVGTDTNSPQEPMHWVLQTEGDTQTPKADVSGHVQIDWVAAWVPE